MIKNIFSKIKEHGISDSYRIACNVLKKRIQIIRNFGFSWTRKLRRAEKEGLEEYIDCLTDFMSEFLAEDKVSDEAIVQNQSGNSRIVWSMWWQGVDSMPEMNKICYESHKKYVIDQGLTYIMITRDNYKQYVEIPGFIEEKVEKGIVSFTHLSDWLRCALLEKYGGVWLDITIMLTSPFPKDIFDYPFYSFNMKDTGNELEFLGQSLFQGNISGFFLCFSAPHNPLITFVKDALTKYWSRYNVPVNYYIMLLSFRVAYLKSNYVKQLFDNIPVNNVHLYYLLHNMNEVFSENNWKSITSDTTFYKTTHKRKYFREKENAKTFYGYLCDLYKL